MLDAQTAALLDELAANPAPKLWEISIAEARQTIAALFAEAGIAPRDDVDAVDRAIPGPAGEIGVRLYRPNDAAGPLPVLVYFHGGGMIANSVEVYDAVCRELSRGAGALVVSVEYRLAPEHRFPAAVDDAYAAAVWVHANAASIGGDAARVAVGGDSAGGNLAAVVSQLARDRGGPEFVFQLLIYPAVGARGHSGSMAEFATGFLFERDEYDWLYEQYLDDPLDALDPRVSPIAAEDFSALPPALVVTAGHDIMRDDAEHYAELLRRAGVPAETRRYETTIHAFLSLAGRIDAGRQAIADCAQRLREVFASGPPLPTFENEYVRIGNVTANGNPAVTVDLESGKVEYEESPDSAGIDRPPGRVRVELKAAPKVERDELDALRVDPERYRVELENERVRVVRLNFGPRERGLMVHHPPRVLVTLTDVAVKLVFADGSTDERSAPAGVAGWLEAETLQTENAADEPLEVVLVEPKALAG
jgi:acetyl esterase